jgi:EAL domain-containing protein (putative c-di-GMP-specific phosphodiesterase class I)
MNLPAAGRLAVRRRRPVLTGASRVRLTGALRLHLREPGMPVLLIGLGIVVAAAVLELLNPRNYWILFEDVSCGVAPVTAAMAVGIAAARSEPKLRNFRVALTISMSLVAAGQLIADIPDVTHASIGSLGAVSDACYVVGAFVGVVTLLTALYRRLAPDARRAVLLDGLILMAASVTFVFADWLHQSLVPGGSVGLLLADPTAKLIVPLVSVMFFASAAAAAVAALALRIEPSRRGVWPVGLGIVLLALAWQGWIGRFLAGAPDTIEPMDFIFPAGALATAFGGVTWHVRTGGGPRYEAISGKISDWLPIGAIVGCVILDVMPRSRPLEVDPIAVGTCIVVLLAVARQRVSVGRERVVSRRLTTEMSERAATAFSLARLEAGATVEETAERICAEALHIDGIDTITVMAFTPAAVVPLAQGGPPTRPVAVGEPIPEGPAAELREHADFGLWLESWTDRAPRSDFDRDIAASGLLAEALAPLIWNDETIGLLAMGATSPVHARHLADRLATLTEFSVMSAAVLGPMLSERSQRERVRAEVQSVIDQRAFRPVFQPIVELATRRFVGFEALTRFSDGTRPDLRFLAADKVGMMVRLETACLREQVEAARSLPAGSFLSLNVSPALAVALTPLLDVLSETDRPLVLEVTEHVEIEDYPRLMASFDSLRDRVRLAVDDAGAGYAGLRHIIELRPAFVKLDISLVRNVDVDAARQAMITGMAHFAESVGCALIAEGIETENELTAVQLLNVRYGQGYFMARPAPVETFMLAPAPAPPRAPRRVARPKIGV